MVSPTVARLRLDASNCDSTYRVVLNRQPCSLAHAPVPIDASLALAEDSAVGGKCLLCLRLCHMSASFEHLEKNDACYDNTKADERIGANARSFVERDRSEALWRLTRNE